MSRIIVSEFVTVDGVMEAPGGGEPQFPLGGWSFKFQRGPEGDKFKLDELASAGALLLGRKTYEGFAAFWPKMPPDPDGFTDSMNNIRKYVVSSTLASPTWKNSTVVAIDDVAALKRQATGDLLVYGSARLVQGLTDRHLVDEYRLMVFPTTLGIGKQLFTGLREPASFRLSDTKRVGPDGIIILTYIAT